MTDDSEEGSGHKLPGDVELSMDDLAEMEEDVGLVEVDELHKFIASIVHRIGFEKKFQSTRGKTIDQPFAVHESKIRELDDFARSRLNELDIPSDDVIEFKAEVGYEDLSEAVYTNLDDLFMRAGDEDQAPSHLLLVWKVLLPNLLAAKITIVFDAKKSENKLKKSELLMDPGPNSEIKFRVAGEEESRDWVERTGEYLDSKLKDTTLSQYYYKPLKIFRSNTVSHSVSWGIGWIGFIISIGLLGDLFENANNTSESEIRNQILSADDMTEKFNIYSGYIFREDSPIIEPLFELGGSIVVFLTLLAATRHLLPKLAPRSGILIGSHESIWKQYDNLVRLVIFVGVFGSLITWVVVTLLDILLL